MKVFIIGLGWLGQPLALHLKAQGHQVAGTSRDQKKCAKLSREGIDARIFDLYEWSTKTPSSQISNNSAIDSALVSRARVLINIAPGRRSIEIAPYVDAMCRLIDYLFVEGAAHLSFVSTTSVFGNEVGLLNEQSKINPQTGSGIAHSKIEAYIMQHYASKAAIIRLAGLIGANTDGSLRHPVTSLVKRDAIKNGYHRVNLLHQQDAIECISALINTGISGRILHACSDEHPSRQEYYNWASKVLGLGKVNFLQESNDTANRGKIIDARESLDSLNVTLKYPSPFDML